VKKPNLFKTIKANSNIDRPRKILEMLTDAARNGQTLLFGEVMQAVGLTYQDAGHRQRFKKDLRAAVSQSELYPHNLLLSVLLLLKIQQMPEDEFLDMAQELGLFTAGKDSKTVFYKEHLARVFRYYEEK
jgi:hypothetical protein